MSNNIFIGIGEYRVARSPAILKTVLGSCVGVCCYDPFVQVGGVAHVYLPEAPGKDLSSFPLRTDRRYDFADLLIPLMLREIVSRGGKLNNMTTLIAGGACLLEGDSKSAIDIGSKNLAKVHEVLREKGLSYKDCDIHGRKGRTIRFFLETGDLEIVTHA